MKPWLSGCWTGGSVGILSGALNAPAALEALDIKCGCSPHSTGWWLLQVLLLRRMFTPIQDPRWPFLNVPWHHASLHSTPALSPKHTGLFWSPLILRPLHFLQSSSRYTPRCLFLGCCYFCLPLLPRVGAILCPACLLNFWSNHQFGSPKPSLCLSVLHFMLDRQCQDIYSWKCGTEKGCRRKETTGEEKRGICPRNGWSSPWVWCGRSEF